MADTLKFAVVGYGNIGRRHCEELMKHPEAELVAVADIDELLAAEVTDKLQVPFFNSLDAFFLSNIEVDVVNICTPNGSHVQLAHQALNFYNHIVCEKPMGLKAAECLKLIDFSKEVDRKLYCVMQNRYSPPSVWLRSLVDEGRLGEILTVKVDCYWNRDSRYYKPGSWRGTLEHDGGPLFTQFSHFVDLLYWLFGDIDNIQARFNNYTHQHNTAFEDTGYVTFDFKQGGSGAFNYSTCAFNRNLESSITILGSKGTVKVSGQYMSEVVHCEIEDYNMPELPKSNPPNQYAGYEGSASNHYAMIENVISDLQGRPANVASADDGYHVVDMIERMYKQR